MSRSALVTAIAARTQQPAATVEAVIEGLASVLVSAAADGTRIHLPGVFTLETVVRAARQGRNPQTGEALMIAERRVPKLTAGATLKRAAAGE